MRRVERGARGSDLRELESRGEERGKEHIRDIHGVGRWTGEGRRGRGLRAVERDSGTERLTVDRLVEEQGAWGLLWGAEGEEVKTIAGQPTGLTQSLAFCTGGTGKGTRERAVRAVSNKARRPLPPSLLLFVLPQPISDHHFARPPTLSLPLSPPSPLFLFSAADRHLPSAVQWPNRLCPWPAENRCIGNHGNSHMFTR